MRDVRERIRFNGNSREGRVEKGGGGKASPRGVFRSCMLQRNVLLQVEGKHRFWLNPDVMSAHELHSGSGGRTSGRADGCSRAAAGNTTDDGSKRSAAADHFSRLTPARIAGDSGVTGGDIENAAIDAREADKLKADIAPTVEPV